MWIGGGLVLLFYRVLCKTICHRRKKARAGGNAGKAKTIARSNEGCYRTRIFCPRCKEEWGLPIQVRTYMCM